ncbi:family 78 glycoside hydrolase catalytic domain [Streptomyces sp. NPDC091268]|uniref:family 78 glycoside hydrolase catalytic domain n=1 Tax=Streptomyces sp. NPDC091268 TaxID=3365979 RepID=UPI0038001190
MSSERGAPVGILHVVKPTVEYAACPLGLDTQRPRLSWQLLSDRPGQVQSAYQIHVATSADRLHDPDVWDSSRVPSDQSVLVPYAGPALAPRTRYHWSVRVWDADGVAGEWSDPSWWETGLLNGSDWTARWIGAPEALVNAAAAVPLPGMPTLRGAQWIRRANSSAQGPAERTGTSAAVSWFRVVVDVPAGLRRACLVLAADGGLTAYVGGIQVLHTVADPTAENWRRPAVAEVTAQLRPGRAAVAVRVDTRSTGSSGAGLLGVLQFTTADAVRRVRTCPTWKTTGSEPAGNWSGPDFDDSAWAFADESAPRGRGPRGAVAPAVSPAFQLRREFRLPAKQIARARLYATALGLYEAHLNGRRVGADELAPGWTDYRRRVQYQTYDVTGLLHRGAANTLGFHLADGWYAGTIASFGRGHYGERPSLLAQLEVTFTDGSAERVVSDQAWRAAAGPLVSADLIGGEDYDARRETDGWTRPGFDDSGWQPVLSAAATTPPAIVAQVDAPVRVAGELPARQVAEVAPGVFVFDLGQNMVGSVRLKVSGAAGTVVRLRHAEALNPDGTLHTANLRSARATDTYTLKGGSMEVYEPRFTFHGFRYVEVTGYPGVPPLDAVTGRVMHTSAPFTMDFETDVPMLNQLHSNITWGQRGNFLSVPTDTPARDERLGWSGDIGVFAPTAAYVMGSARFLTKWLRDLYDAQRADGAFPDVAPQIGMLGAGTAGWGDAGVTVPWALYQAYGDTRVLEEAWEPAKRWLDYLHRHSDGYLRPATGYGDWLNLRDETPKDVLATAHFAHSAHLVAHMARALGDDPAPYEELTAAVRGAFRAAYVSQDGGRIKGDTQTAYVLGLSMDLLPERERGRAADRLVELIEAREGHLSTGFLGTPQLLGALTAAGRTDVAYRLLLQESFPGWGYQIAHGATTMWEHWDSVREDGSFKDAGMNSFNHYAYGAVGAWMYANIAGIAPAAPGFRRLLIRPRPSGAVTGASARFDSLYGPVTTRWKAGSGGFTLHLGLPVGTSAEVWVPARAAADVHAGDAQFLRMDDGCAVFTAGSGRHLFRTGRLAR